MNIDKIVELAQASQSMMTRRIVKSAMTPVIVLCLSSPMCFITAYMLREDVFLSRLLGIVGTIPILVACGMYVYFGLVKTDKLQSEDYQIRQELLQMISSQGGKIKVEPISIEMITKPDEGPIDDAGKGAK